jgi:hypothetical protein
VFLGYSNLHKGFKCLDPSTGRGYVSRDVILDENIFPFSKLQPNVGARLRSEILLLPSSLNPLPNGVNNCDLPLANSPNCPNPKSAIFDDVQLANIDGTATKADFPARQTPVGAYSGVDSIFAGTDFPVGAFLVRVPSSVRTGAHMAPPGAHQLANAPSPPGPTQSTSMAVPRAFVPQSLDSTDDLVPNSSAGALGSTLGSSVVPAAPAKGGQQHQASVQHPKQHQSVQRHRTRLSEGIRRPRVYTDGTIHYGMIATTSEPSNLSEALGDDNWKRAMDSEVNALEKIKTWHMIPPQKGNNIIDCKCVYKIKRKADGSLDRYKTRLVAKGFKQ